MGIDLYPEIIHEEDLSPESIGEEIDALCDEINAACEGWGTDEERLLNVMGSLTPETRIKVEIKFQEKFDKSLRKTMESEAGNRDFGTALQILATSPLKSDCRMIHDNCESGDSNHLLLITILCGRTNKEMELMKKQYFAMYDKDLSVALAEEMGGDLEKMIMNVLQANEEEVDPDFHTDDLIEEDITKLYEMGQGRWGTDELGLFKIICARPAEYLVNLNNKYAEKYSYSLMEVFDRELGGKIKDAALYNLGMKVDPYGTMADMVEKAMKGWGTNELFLTACLIRYHLVLKEVMVQYVEKYGTTIEDRVKSETSGDYEKLLVKVLTAVE